MSMKFQITTPDDVAVSTKVDYVYLPGGMGEVGILPQHTAMITSLVPGELRYKPLNEPEKSLVVGAGFVRIDDDKILMVTDLALEASQIDESSTEEAIARAQEVLKSRSKLSQEEQARFEANLTKQIIMLNFKRKHRTSEHR